MMFLSHGKWGTPMILYSVIVFAAAVSILVLGRCIAKGNTNLINCYHPERVKDKNLYCKKMGRAMSAMGVSMLVSSVVGLLGESFAIVAVVVLFVGETGGVTLLLRAQKKYGGGVF